LKSKHETNSNECVKKGTMVTGRRKCKVIKEEL